MTNALNEENKSPNRDRVALGPRARRHPPTPPHDGPPLNSNVGQGKRGNSPMYYWNLSKLVLELKAGTITEAQKFRYLMFSMITVTLISDPIMFVGSRYNTLDAIGLILNLLISTLGMYYCFLQNRRGDNIDFITRFVCLSIPITVRLLIIFFPLAIFFASLEIAFELIFKGRLLSEINDSTTLGRSLMIWVSLITYYAYLGKWIRLVSAQPRAPAERATGGSWA